MNSLSPVKYRGRYEPQASIKMLLKQLGMPKSVWAVRNFWEHWHGQLEFILHDAEKLYRIHARRVHPRHQNDAEEESKQLNALWIEIKRRFKQHTEPNLWVPTGKQDKKQRGKRPPRGYYRRTCALPKCGCTFLTKQKSQKYCCRLHAHVAYAHTYYVRTLRPRKKRTLHKCEFRSCGSLFWAVSPTKRRRFCTPKCAHYYHAYAWKKRNVALVNAKARKKKAELRQAKLEAQLEALPAAQP